MVIMKRFFNISTKIIQKFRDQAVLLGSFIILLLCKPIQLVDDALISFRYASNLAYHGELVYNLGERVEGITNFLWTLVLSGFAKMGLDIGFTAIYISLFLILWMGYRTWQLGKILTSNSFIGVQAWSLVIFSSGFWLTMTNGLEAPLFAALILEIVYQIANENNPGAFFFAGLVFFTRPEGLGLIAILFIVTILREDSFLDGLKGLGIALGMVLCLELFRYLYYGSLLPNSVIAKSFPSHMYLSRWILKNIYSYFSGFVKANLHLVIASVGALLVSFQTYRKGDKQNSILLFSLGGILVAGFAIIKNGGDWMIGYRLIFQYSPLFIVFFIYLLKDHLIHRFVWFAIIVGLVIPLYPIQPISNLKKLVNFNDPATELFYHWSFILESCERLSPILFQGDQIATEGLGYVGYNLKDHYVHDLLGLTDKNLAKTGEPYIMYGKGDPIYSLAEVQPAVVIAHNKSFIQKADQDLLDLYHTYCYQDCNSQGSDIVMIRLDRVEALGSGFHDWKTISLQSSLP